MTNGFAEAGLSHNQGPTIPLQKSGQNFRGAGTVAVNQHHDRSVIRKEPENPRFILALQNLSVLNGDAGIVIIEEHLAQFGNGIAVPRQSGDGGTFHQQHVGDIHSLLHATAGVSTHVEHQAGQGTVTLRHITLGYGKHFRALHRQVLARASRVQALHHLLAGITGAEASQLHIDEVTHLAGLQHWHFQITAGKSKSARLDGITNGARHFYLYTGTGLAANHVHDFVHGQPKHRLTVHRSNAIAHLQTSQSRRCPFKRLRINHNRSRFTNAAQCLQVLLRRLITQSLDGTEHTEAGYTQAYARQFTRQRLQVSAVVLLVQINGVQFTQSMHHGSDSSVSLFLGLESIPFIEAMLPVRFKGCPLILVK